MNRRSFGLALLLSATVIATTAGVASAFPFAYSWHTPASGNAPMNRTGAGGIYGTGSSHDYGIKCTDCHVDGAGMIDFNVTATPPFGTVAGDLAYTPGQRYTIQITMTGEHLRPGTMNNLNGMSAAIEDAGGVVRGRFIADAGQDSRSCPTACPYPMNRGWPATATTFMYGDCHAVLPIPRQGLTAWSFDWVAPAAGTGDLTLFVGVVDGDTGGASSLDDDALERSIPLVEGP